MSRIIRSLCAVPSFGTLGTPSFLGGTSGVSSGDSAGMSDAELDALGGRAVIASGHTITDAEDLAGGWAFTSDEVVWFDGYAALHGLSLHAASADFSASFWFNRYPEGAGSPQVQKWACIFGNSAGYLGVCPDGQFTPTQFRLMYTPNPPVSVAGMNLPSIHNHTTEPSYPINVGWSLPSSTAGGVAASEIDEMQGWQHVMYSHKVVGGQPDVTIYVNDTAVITHNVPSTNTFHPGLYNDETWVFPWDAPTFTSFDSTSCPWTVGGTEYYQYDGSVPNTDVTLPTGGDGLVGAMTEVWIAPGQYIDWSNSANRLKFHNVDLTGRFFAPADLGRKGATPTGTSPQYYFTGGPTKFVINRASGKAVRCYHRNTPYGLIDRMTSYGIIPGPV